MKLAVQTVNIDLTTDSLNQLLVLQNSFIKVNRFFSTMFDCTCTPPLCVLATVQEVNELVQLFINIRDSLPQQRWQQSSNSRHKVDPDTQKPVMDPSGVEILSLLDSCRLSVDEICITVSTPLCTALRFSTSRIDMLIMNSGGQAIAGQQWCTECYETANSISLS